MNDPYSVLGVAPTASDEEIKKVYRELARKYHPDVYQNNPLADLAVEKMQEINEAYETINKMRKAGQGQSFGQNANSYQASYGGSSSNPVYAQVRAHLQARQTVQAEQLLRTVTTQDAEWYFLMGVLNNQRGHLDIARQCFQTACQMNPLNPEYQQAFQTMQQGGGFPPQGSYVRGGCCPCPCDCCTTFLCLNACCPC